MRFRDIPAKSRDIPPKKFDSLGFEGHTELFGPHPFTWKTPTPPENVRTQKFRFGFYFSCLNLGCCPSTVRPVFPVLVFQLGKQQNRTRTTSSTVLGTPPNRTLGTFRRSYRDPPTRTYPSGTDPPETLRPDLISTRFRPDSDLKRVISGPNQVEIGSKSGPKQVWAEGFSWVGARRNIIPGGRVPAAPRKVPSVLGQRNLPLGRLLC